MVPLVSVLIPCFNAASFIRETLESVLAQTWPNLETIVVDDGSTDAGAEIVAAFAERVTLIRQETCGAGSARNRAFASSRGRFIQFLDADDLISPNKIAAQMARLEQLPDAVASAEWSRFHGAPSEAQFVADQVSLDMAPVDWLVESRGEGHGMMFPALWLAPRAVIARAGPWKERLSVGDDTEYFTRVLLAADRVLFCEGARCYYRSGLPGSLSGRKSPVDWLSQFEALESCESNVRALEDSDRVRRVFALSWQRLAHQAYPYDPALAEAAMETASRLHPVRAEAAGGPKFKAVARTVGWRLARRLQVAAGGS